MPRNKARIKEVEEVGAVIMRRYLQHDITFEYATTQIDDGTKDVEDFAAIPDIITGATADIVSNLPSGRIVENGQLVLAPTVPHKAKVIAEWLSRPAALKHLLLIITDVGNGSLQLQLLANRPVA